MKEGCSIRHLLREKVKMHKAAHSIAVVYGIKEFLSFGLFPAVGIFHITKGLLFHTYVPSLVFAKLFRIILP